MQARLPGGPRPFRLSPVSEGRRDSGGAGKPVMARLVQEFARADGCGQADRPDLYQAILDDVAAVHRQIPRGRMR